MRKILIAVCILWSFAVFSQDSTIATLSIKARLVQNLAPFVKQGYDTAYINLLNRWIKKYDVANPPGGTTLVTVDSIAVTVIADCYRKAKSYPQGAAGVGADFESDIASIRAGNTYLDRLCDAIDAAYSGIISTERNAGRRILTGRNQ